MLQLSMNSRLDLAHLTWCSALDTQADFMMYMLISPVAVLRYGTYVDTAAPLFSWSFLQQIVLPTLVEAQTGTKAICSMHPVYGYMALEGRQHCRNLDVNTQACSMRKTGMLPMASQ